MPNEASRETVTGFFIVLLTGVLIRKRERKNYIVTHLKEIDLEIGYT